MKRAFMPVVYLCASATLASAAGLSETTYQSFNPKTGNFDLTQSIGYQLPNPQLSGPGPYPVFIWVPGTFEKYEDPLAQFLISEMALRGFIAATVQYDDNEVIQACKIYTPRAQGIFDSSRSTSASSVLCSLPQASCDGGLVTMGGSQGGFMAVLAKNYDPRVQAVYALSMSDYAQNMKEPFHCVDKQNTAIPANRLMIVNGASDPVFGGQTPLMNVSGFTCANGTQQCWSPDGSGAGWYMVQNSQVVSGDAGHCYFLNANQTTCAGTGDPTWLYKAENWSLNTNLDWLATMGTTRVFSQDGY